MIHLQDVTEFFGREWQAISGAPVAFIIAVLIASAIIGILVGVISWKLRGQSARSKIGRLLEFKLAEDDVLAQVRAKHEHEIEVREEIEVELERLQGAVRRLHDSDLSSDQLIVDASTATTKAVEVLKRSQDEFVNKLQTWDRQRAAMHEKASADHKV
jgi:type II secretory pathway pseudopilin PulG